MSNSSSAVFPPGLVLTGGIPIKHQDFFVSIIFAGLYLLLALFAAWRVLAPASRCWTLVRPAIFVIVRIVTFGVRAIQANGNENKNYFITEQVLLLTGFILLCEPFLGLVGYHVKRNETAGAPRSMLATAAWLLEKLLLVAMILGAYAGVKMGSLVSSDGTVSSSLSTVEKCRDANAFLSFGIVILGGVLVIAGALHQPLPRFQTMYLVIVAIVLVIPSAYKIALYELTAPNPLNSRTKVAFYALSSVPELLVATTYFVLNLKVLFDIEASRARDKEDKAIKKGGGSYATVPLTTQGFAPHHPGYAPGQYSNDEMSYGNSREGKYGVP